nr:MAG TPA: hypothetical protein [Caudoviricetes sp.]
MTRKRFIKLLMARGVPRNEAVRTAYIVVLFNNPRAAKALKCSRDKF